jgi:hypothetical protein
MLFGPYHKLLKARFHFFQLRLTLFRSFKFRKIPRSRYRACEWIGTGASVPVVRRLSIIREDNEAPVGLVISECDGRNAYGVRSLYNIPPVQQRRARAGDTAGWAQQNG